MANFKSKIDARWKQVIIATLAFRSSFTFDELLMACHHQWPGRFTMQTQPHPCTLTLHRVLYAKYGLIRDGLMSRVKKHVFTLTMKGFAVRHQVAEEYRDNNVSIAGRN